MSNWFLGKSLSTIVLQIQIQNQPKPYRPRAPSYQSVENNLGFI